MECLHAKDLWPQGLAHYPQFPVSSLPLFMCILHGLLQSPIQSELLLPVMCWCIIQDLSTRFYKKISLLICENLNDKDLMLSDMRLCNWTVQNINFIADNSISVHLMAWCYQVTSHYAEPMLTLFHGFIWIRTQRCNCLVAKFCYQLIAKLSNNTAPPLWTDPYAIIRDQIVIPTLLQFLIAQLTMGQHCFM